MNSIDDVIGILDQGLRTVFGEPSPKRPSPAAEVAGNDDLDEASRRRAAGLMRVNHTGEICAQAMYEGQARTARDPATREALTRAAQEEHDHLGWCGERLHQLDGRPSVLNPGFYAASWVLGAAVGLLGDRVSLGLVEATEDEVCRHLDGHLARLPDDPKSRAIIEAMREDESRHGNDALREGAAAFPDPVRRLMRAASRVMTVTTYRL